MNSARQLRRHGARGFTLVEVLVALGIVAIALLAGLQALLTKPTTAPVPPNWKSYLDLLPNDPWGKPYVYLNPGIKGEIDVMSLGADGQAGGEGKNADIGSWQP